MIHKNLKPKKIPVIICNIIVIPNKKPRFQKELIWRGQGYDCKWDFISNTKDILCEAAKGPEVQDGCQETWDIFQMLRDGER